MARLAAILVFLKVILPSGSVRTAQTSDHKTSAPLTLKKCVALGVSGGHYAAGAEGMIVTKGVTNRIKECSNPTDWEGGKPVFTYVKMFAEAMSVKLAISGMCVCSTGITEVVRFKPSDEQKEDCSAKSRARRILSQCWTAYEKKRGMVESIREMTASGGYVALKSGMALWSDKNFQLNVDGDCTAGDDCDTVVLPSAISGADADTKRELRRLVKKVLAGDVADLTAEQQEFADGMNSDEICAILDSDGDGDISPEELAAFYEGENLEDIKQWVKEVQDNRSDEKKKTAPKDGIDCEEFEEFQEKMRAGKANNRKCVLPTALTGTDTTKCDTSEGAITAAECTLSCDSSHHGSPAAACENDEEGEFTIAGACEENNCDSFKCGDKTDCTDDGAPAGVTCKCKEGFEPSKGNNDAVECPCPAGSTLSAPESGEECTECAAGTYSSTADSTECTTCEGNTYSTSAGSTECKECKEGEVVKPDKTDCECPPGSSSAGGSCTECPAGTYSSNADSTECTKCKGNEVASSAGLTECTACEGKFANFDKTDCNTAKAKWTAVAFPAGPAAGDGGDDGAGAGEDDGASAGAGVPAGAVASVVCYQDGKPVDPKECVDDKVLGEREWYDDAEDDDAKAAGASRRAAIIAEAMEEFNAGCDEDQ